jgi:transcriptional regulator with XRE-family HTH domain
MTFGKNMKRIRETLGLTQEELANRAKLQPSAISHFETGGREPSLKNIIKICKGLGCSPNVLIDT